jgi:hypothetical protein
VSIDETAVGLIDISRHTLLLGWRKGIVLLDPGFARSSLWREKSESEDARMVRSSGLRQGRRNFYFLE